LIQILFLFTCYDLRALFSVSYVFGKPTRGGIMPGIFYSTVKNIFLPVVVLFFVSHCSSNDATPKECNMCDRMAAKCSTWDADDHAKCLRRCRTHLEYPAHCQSKYKTALACFQDENNWDCKASAGVVGCVDQFKDYLACKTGQWVKMPNLPEKIGTLAQDPSNESILYAGSAEYGKGGVYKSTDGGLAWKQVSENLPSYEISSLAVCPGDSSVLLVAVGNVVYKSTDGGAKWTKMQAVSDAYDVSQMTIASRDCQKAYAVVNEVGFIRTEDGGKNWSVKNEGLPTKAFDQITYLLSQCFAVDPKNSQVVYIGMGQSGLSGFNHGIYKSSDSGDSWKAANQGIDNMRITSLAMPSSNVLYGGVNSSSEIGEILFESKDAGVSWSLELSQENSDFSMPVIALKANRQKPGQVWALDMDLQLIGRSGKNKTWQILAKLPVSAGWPHIDARKTKLLVVISDQTPVLIANTADGGAFRYTLPAD
jgi:photosystem II stability/assembly factor-like uncharacterized protein